MENKKIVLWTIVVLLVIFVPLTIIGYFSQDNRNPFDQNPGHDFYYHKQLWFYDENDELISSYDCNTEGCDYASSTIDDEEYKINYYKEGTLTKTNLINNSFAFLKDGALVNLFSVADGTMLQSYKALKNYNTLLYGNVYILQDSDDNWGAISIEGNLGSVLPFEYEFIGLKNDLTEEGALKTNTFIVKKNGSWFLVGNDNFSLSSEFNYPIVDYNDRFIFVNDEGRIRGFSYKGDEYNSEGNYKGYVMVENYMGLVTDNAVDIFTEENFTPVKSIEITGTEEELSLVIEDDNLILKNGEEVIETIALSMELW